MTPGSTTTASAISPLRPLTGSLTAAAATTATAAVTSTVSLKDTVAGMDPQDVWQNFYELTQIPRPSHHEEQVE